MDAIKKIIHPHKHSHHEHDPTTSTSASSTQQQDTSVLRNRDTGENMANPFMEQNTTKADQFRQTHHAAGDTTAADSHVPGTNPLHPVEGSHLAQHSSGHTHTTPVGESAVLGGAGHSRHAPAVPEGGARHDTHHGHHPTGTTTKGGTHDQQSNAPTGVGASAGQDGHVPGVNAGGAKVVEARMPVEEGNNFPGTNPNPAHSMLGTREEGELKFAGSG
ncbi:hypothetical protein GE09DRAFT_1277037 [Coniochaeta sp. 2T2.1]|nr:hypothetical protein GE09DRAFT_1277037 [Coniochaeta sp. 2T2.1]